MAAAELAAMKLLSKEVLGAKAGSAQDEVWKVATDADAAESLRAETAALREELQRLRAKAAWTERTMEEREVMLKEVEELSTRFDGEKQTTLAGEA